MIHIFKDADGYEVWMDDLRLMIEALGSFGPSHTEANAMAKDLRELRDSAFPNGGAE